MKCRDIIAKRTTKNRKTLPKPKSKSKQLIKPASIAAQKAWAGFPLGLKKELRRALPDTDKDKVPNGFDCRPRNKRRQESFLPADAAYLNSNPGITLGEYVAGGSEGDVFEVAGNRNFIVKLPKTYTSKFNTSSFKRAHNARSQELFNDEMTYYTNNDLYNKPLFIPTKVVPVTNPYIGNRQQLGLIKPKIAPVTDYSEPVPSRNLFRVTEAQLIDLRDKLVDLSYEGFGFEDGLQVGIDRAGRLLVYDLGKMAKYRPGSDRPFHVNNNAWQEFLGDIGRFPTTNSAYKRYGMILKRGWSSANLRELENTVKPY